MADMHGKSLRIIWYSLMIERLRVTELYIKIQFIPHSKHYISVMKTSHLMLYWEITAVCSEIHTKQIYCVGRT